MRVTLLLGLLAVTFAAPAQVVIYRCTDANGALTVQNDVPCPKGSRQDKRIIGEVPTASAPAFAPPPAVPVAPVVPAPTATTAPAPAPVPATSSEPTIADSDRLPPPVLFECRTYDNDRYLSDDGNPSQRCVPLETTGLGGLGTQGSGQACEMRTDQCQRVADGALCEQWRLRLREAQSQLRFGVRGTREESQAELERIERVVRESTCGQ